MTYDEARTLYIEKFGEFPDFLFMGADESEVLPYIQEALKSGKEIELPQRQVC